MYDWRVLETSRSIFQRSALQAAMEQANLRGAWLGVDLVALAENVRAIRATLASGTRLMAVVKADAYGHGAGAVAEAALQNGATSLGVATVEEGVRLRRSGHEAPILILGIIPDAAYSQAIEHGLQLTVSSGRQIQVIERIARGLGKRAELHLKVNTGMTRVGCELHEAGGLAQYILHASDIHLAGLCSHLATSDAPDESDALSQIEKFQSLSRRLKSSAPGLLCHMANSGGALHIPDSHFDMVRVGLAMYGHPPRAAERAPVHLFPAVSVRARVSQVKDVPANTRVGYGLTWATETPTRLALVPVGYGDGLPRALSNQGSVLLRGRRRPIVGIISMDQTLVDAGDVPVEPGEEVVLLGGQGQEVITVDSWAQLSGTIVYEILCGLGQRLPRVYYR